MANSQERRLKVIVFSDVVDSSAQIFADELIAIQRIKEDLAMIGEILKRHGGSLVKSLGDGILATFDAPTQALEFVEDVVICITRRGHHSLQHRFGLHTGEIYVNGDDIIGQGVHLASRLQTTAPVNGVAFVQSTFDLIDPRFQRLAELVGPVQLKGLPLPVITYAIGAPNLIGRQGGQLQSEIDVESLLSETPYRLERPLGFSPHTTTFLVREASRDRRAVLKVIPCDATNLDALQIEAACLDRLRHPHLPRFVDGFAHRGSFLFLQEYIAGASLQGSLDFLRRKQRLAEMLRHVLEVLEVIHGAGIVHGDLHPSNLIPGEDGRSLFVVDFDLLKAQTSGAPVEGEPRTGRAFFSPPERARFGSIAPAGDLYALGVLGLSLYTGQPPEELYDQDQGRWRLDDLDQEVVAWLSPMLEESLAHRVASARDALQLLDRPLPPSPSSAEQPELLRRVPLPPLPNLRGAIRKAVLERQLAATYGPVVELLLQTCPTSIPNSEVEGLRQRLVAAGLGRADVDRALEESVEPPSSEAAEANPATAVSATAVSAPAAAPPDPDRREAPAMAAVSTPSADRVEAWRAEMLNQLSLMVGPIAEALCTDSLFDALMGDPAAARRMLLASAVPDALVADILALAERTRPSATPDPVTTAKAPAVQPPAAPKPPAAPTDHQLREPVVDLIGPIGNTLLDALADLPLEERPEALIRALEGYGVEPSTLAELRRRWGAIGLP
ncbi:protein kinase domain-containing protein [Aphanothece microscopica]